MSLAAIVISMRELVADGRRYVDRSLPADVADELDARLAGLEHDLVDRPAGVRCDGCGSWFRWPGELAEHVRWRHREAA